MVIKAAKSPHKQLFLPQSPKFVTLGKPLAILQREGLALPCATDYNWEMFEDSIFRTMKETVNFEGYGSNRN